MIELFSVNLNNYKRKISAVDSRFEMRKIVKIQQKKKQEFHTMRTRGLFLCKCARIDIQTEIVFLTTKSQRTGRRSLERIIENIDIFEWNKIISFGIKCRWNEHFEIVCGRKLCNKRRH